MMTFIRTAIISGCCVRPGKEKESLLHKMRNILNSVHVSAGVIHQRLQAFHVDDIGRIADMLDAHSHDYGWYLTQDSKGKKIPQFLGRLSEEMTRNHLDILAELSILNDHLEQLDCLLTAEQHPSRAGKFQEDVHFATVMEEALAPHQRELNRLNVKICRMYEIASEGVLEVSKLLHILTILIQNATDAMREMPGQLHQLTLSILPCPDRMGFVRFQVADTGIGIPPDDLTLVFSPNMSGEQATVAPNLQFSAVEAKELNGSLRVWSNGPQEGTVCTLDVPAIYMEGER